MTLRRGAPCVRSHPGRRSPTRSRSPGAAPRPRPARPRRCRESIGASSAPWWLPGLQPLLGEVPDRAGMERDWRAPVELVRNLEVGRLRMNGGQILLLFEYGLHDVVDELL